MTTIEVIQGKGRVFVRGCLLLLLLVLIGACEGMFEGVYDSGDDREEEKDNKGAETFPKSGLLTIDATSYTKWHYISFKTGKQATTDISLETLEESWEPEEWDIAIHHYDVKTNGCRVMAESDTTGIYDEWSRESIMVDLSQMMDSIVVYAPGYTNALLGSWIEVDLSTMPPIYTMDGRWFRVVTRDGREIRLRLLSYISDKSVKGHLTIEYATE